MSAAVPKESKNHSKFKLSVWPHVVIWIIFASIIGGSLGVLLWRRTQNSSMPTSSVEGLEPGISGPTPAQQNMASIHSNDDYIVIKEWGVRFKPAAGMTPLYKKLEGTTDAETIGFTSEELQRVDTGCGLQVSGFSGPLGTLRRAKTPITDPPRQLLKQIGDYYYYFTHPQSPCAYKDISGNAVNLELNTDQIAKMNTSITSLEAAQ